MDVFSVNRPWSHAEEQKLITMWKAGDKGGVIAAALGRTRSTILGKVHRMRKYGLLEYRDEPLRRAAEAEYKRQKEAARPKAPQGGKRIAQFNPPPRPMVEPIVAPSKAPEVPFDPSKDYPKIGALTRTMCRHIMTADTSCDALYCGDRVHRLSYCKGHHARFYHRVATNRELAA
jgi:hypothetical protein